ncbi:hypothetical protein P280DRAFT_512821 [Massarina eburnea CBS 473.64]|uniref:Extracellular membrane protein CFEM domain-containing protein n=1 Tax=Massarina eburnea CBS 473.64 TaxID=1395130 RepID=A0A6A6SFV8_9PLEO|nr:hypothetical protein P280DRAFT_512821 [Massarina eburnea CBS 473.64]
MQLTIQILFAIFGLAAAAGKTHIYIDQIPIYPSLRPCAQDRVSAIIRAQASGCGDDTQLTSFACFCINSSTEYASIISTAVADACAKATATTTSTTLTQATSSAATGPTQTDVKSALDVFNSYCAKSTELARFDQQATLTITQGPLQTPSPSTTSTALPSTSTSKPSTNLAAIIIPSVLLPLAAISALFFYLYRRQARKLQLLQHQNERSSVEPSGSVLSQAKDRELDAETTRRLEMFSDQQRGVEMGYTPYAPTWEKDGRVVAYELHDEHAVELDASLMKKPSE